MDGDENNQRSGVYRRPYDPRDDPSYREKAFKERPMGVIWVAILTILGAVVAGVVAYLLSMEFDPTTEGHPAVIGLKFSIGLLPYLIVPFYASIISFALLLADSKYVWYSSMAFWVLTIFCYNVFALIPSLACLAYFLTPNVRKYFDVSIFEKT